MSIKYCKNSTITEAWAVVLGLPAPIDDTDAAVITRRAREKFGDLHPKPAIVAVQLGPEKLAAPFWNQQFSWAGGKYLARFGHRFLSVHFLGQANDRYETFEKTLGPGIAMWLRIYSDALGATAKEHVVDQVGFGYVNRFEFEPSGFDVSRYFKLNVAVELEEFKTGLVGVETGFRFHDEAKNESLTLSLAAEAGSVSIPKVGVVTKVFAEKRPVELVSFANVDSLPKLVHAAKEAAKRTFFGFATEETRAIMEAVDDAPDSP